jgi:phosphoserine phosphatase RsbU/P
LKSLDTLVANKLAPKPKNAYTSLLSHAGTYRPAEREAPPAVPPPIPAVEPDQRQAELEQDLQLARDLQQGLLLETVPRIPGWELSAVSLPARELGGDLYDFVAVTPREQGIMIGDVSGKGLPAALRMAVARTVFRAESRRKATPGSTLASVNNILIEEMPHGMVTMLYSIINTASGRLRFANAGHNYLILINEDVNEIEATGLPLGVVELDAYTDHCVMLNYGETAMLYTDGIIEATDDYNNLFGFPRLQNLLRSVGHMKPRALMSRILTEVRAWTRGQLKHDDITMVLVRRRLQHLVDEMYSIVADIVGPLTASEWWAALQLTDSQPTPDECVDVLKPLNDIVSQQFGRGIAREVQAQLRPVIEEYRLILPALPQDVSEDYT